MTLRPAAAEDEAFLLALYASTRAEEVAAWGFDESQARSFLMFQFTAQRRHYEAEFPAASDHIIRLGDHDIGRIMVSRSPEEIRLVDIALLPEHRGAGIGAALVSGLVDEARERSLPLRLHVHTTSPARRLYERLGFSVVDDTGVHLLMERRPGS